MVVSTLLSSCGCQHFPHCRYSPTVVSNVVHIFPVSYRCRVPPNVFIFLFIFYVLPMSNPMFIYFRYIFLIADTPHWSVVQPNHYNILLFPFFYICKIYFYIYVQYIILTADTLSLSSPIITVYCRILNLDNRYN